MVDIIVPLVFIHILIRFGNDRFDTVVVFVRRDPGGNGKAVVILAFPLRHQVFQTCNAKLCLRDRTVHENAEFVATGAVNRVDSFKSGRQAFRGAGDKLVAGLVADGIVRPFQSIQVAKSKVFYCRKP